MIGIHNIPEIGVSQIMTYNKAKSLGISTYFQPVKFSMALLPGGLAETLAGVYPHTFTHTTHTNSNTI